MTGKSPYKSAIERHSINGKSTGDEAYHADCFRCVQCSKKIDDLVFTQTSKGIYCTKCHEARKLLRLKRRDERNNVCLAQTTHAKLAEH